MRENSNGSRQRGFSLVELMIVISIIGILVAIGIPAWQSSVRSANEASAITSLQRTSTAQVTYYNSHNRAGYGTFDQLSSGGYIGREFAGDTPEVNGYVFTMTVTTKSSNQPAGYSVNADPLKDSGLTATGNRHFYIGSDVGTPTSNNEKKAGPDDPPVGGGAGASK